MNWLGLQASAAREEQQCFSVSC